MGYLESFLLFVIDKNPFLIAFLVPLIGGEPFFVALAFFAGASGTLPLWLIFISGTLADILDDIFWFYVPRGKIFRKIRIPGFIKQFFKKESYQFRKIEHKDLPLFMIMSKFLVGTRNIAIMSVSLNKISFRKFIPYSILSAFIWSTIVVAVGWSAGKGFVLVKEIFDSTRLAITFVIIFIIVLFFIRHHTHKHTRKKLMK